MRNIVWIILIFLLLALQAQAVNWILLLVVAGVLFSDLQEVLVLAVAGGIIADLISGTPDGLISLTLLSTTLTLYLIFNQVLSHHANRAVLIGSTAFAHVLFVIWFLVFNAVYGIFGSGVSLSLSHFFIHQGLFGLIWNTLLAYPIFQFYLWIDELIPKHNVQPIRD